MRYGFSFFEEQHFLDVLDNSEDWCTENCESEFHVLFPYRVIIFESEIEAMAFKLRWL
jgi:hypothetical protein